MTAKLCSNQTEHAQTLLRKIRFAREDGRKERRDYLVRLHLNSFDAKLVAVHRAYEQLKPHFRPDKAELKAIAERIDPWKGTNEEVRVHWKRKSSNPNDYRLVMNFGIENRALQYLVLRPLEKVFEPHSRQFLMRGVVPAIYELAKAMADGPVCAYELDIKNCYSSFDGAKLASLIPLPKGVITNSIISAHLNLKGATTNIYDLFGPADGDDQSSVKVTTAFADAARRGLPQGSAVSPVVAEMLLALSLNAVPGLGTVFAFADNILLLATSKSNAMALKKALSSALVAHPVGRLQPKVKFFDFDEPVDFLGHRLTKSNGNVHIAPTPKNQEKFEAHVLAELRLLKQQQLSLKKRYEINADLKKYVSSWKNAFRLCDGVEQITTAPFTTKALD